jgi:natural product biosynthesis luciferase-like monooxygenase protein
MSMMFFGDSEVDARGDKYRLLFESARFADQNHFEGLWLPERHFTKFGCLFPSPAVLHAALAKETKNLRLRAGSVVLPLNDPVRVAEEWSVVDNLSGGRVEVAFASGWHPDDFALKPDAYADRAKNMFDGIEAVQQLWCGEQIERRNGAGDRIRVGTYPTPVQKRLPIWLTAAGNPETFRRAGRMGCGVLTHLFNQDIAELEEKIKLYRTARREAGHLESEGRIAVTLHTFVADTIDEVRLNAGEAYCEYLKANLGLLKQLAFSQGQTMELDSLRPAELDEMLHWLFDKFVGGRSLMGTVETSAETCRELARIGVNEVACLLDFGPNTDDVLANLRYLAQLNELCAEMPVC